MKETARTDQKFCVVFFHLCQGHHEGQVYTPLLQYQEQVTLTTQVYNYENIFNFI